MTPDKLDVAYQYCLQTAHKHYENFPVASFLLPQHSRKHVAAIYTFARQADDIADEGQMPAADRLNTLKNMDAGIRACAQGQTTDNPVYLALADTIQRFSLPVELFTDLLSAFTQDVVQQRYINFDDLINYCQRSANPVGRLLLHLHQHADAESCQQSDSICTALQLINFYQDLSQDYHELGRIYIPQLEMAQYGVTEQYFEKSINDDAMRQLMQLQYARVEQLLHHGRGLGKRLGGRFGIEIRLIIAGGERMLHTLRKQDNQFSRPRLTLLDKLWMLKAALLP